MRALLLSDLGFAIAILGMIGVIAIMTYDIVQQIKERRRCRRRRAQSFEAMAKEIAEI